MTEDDLRQALYDEALLEQIAEKYNTRPDRPPGFGFTLQEFSDAEGVSERVAERILKDALLNGDLKRQKMRQGSGGAPWVYYKPEEE